MPITKNILEMSRQELQEWVTARRSGRVSTDYYAKFKAKDPTVTTLAKAAGYDRDRLIDLILKGDV